MNLQKTLKCAAAVMTAVLVYTGISGVVTAETALSGSEEAALVSSISETAEHKSSENKSAEAEWWKAEITDYDSSLSLISYELTPDKSEDEKNGDSADDKKSDSEKTKNSKSADAGSDDGNSTEPSSVESQTTGGYVSEVPQAPNRPSVTANSGEFAFTTYGWGHGVGMSQNGANFYATFSGWSYQDILYHYYPGTYLMNTGTAGSETVTVGGASSDVLSAVAGIVYREVGPSMHVEAIKAQAVAVYSYIKYHGGDSYDLRCQANPPQNVIDACASVLGEALYYDGSYALTMFSASSGGYTANCYEVFTDDIPYLRSVPSDYDAAYDPHYGTVMCISSSEVKRLVEARYGIALSENPSNWFQLTVGSSGYVTEVVIDGQITVRGNDFKACLGLKSSNFGVSYTA